MTVPGHPIREGLAKKRGQSYRAANGGIIENEGEWNLKVQTIEGTNCAITMQVAEVKKPLLSVIKLCRKGNEVTFREDGGEIKNIKTGRKMKFYVENGTYKMDMWVAPCAENGVFSRQYQ